MNLKKAICLLLLSISGCDNAVGSVVLYRNGEMETSDVRKIGSVCWVAWFKGIEKIALRSDGTAGGGNLRYTWTLNTPGPDDKLADAAWFKLNCIDPPTP